MIWSLPLSAALMTRYCQSPDAFAMAGIRLARHVLTRRPFFGIPTIYIKDYLRNIGDFLLKRRRQ
jgi:hypothetical protein